MFKLQAATPVKLFRAVMCLVLAACIGLYVVGTWRWPLTGDASILHYVVFLMHHGMAPYRDILDMNLPGCYFVEDLAMRIFGDGSLGWRLFDFSLSGAALLAMIVIAWPCDWFAGFFAGALLMLLHGRDGMPQAGQRDLSMAVLLLIAVALLFHAVRRNAPWATALFGLCAGLAAIIKPTAAPLAIILLFMAVVTLRTRKMPLIAHLAGGIAGFLVPVALAFGFLLRQHILSAFFEMQRGMVPYYAHLGRRPIGFLLLHSVSPLMPLVVLWLVIAVANRSWNDWERPALLAAAAFGLLSYCIQGKGYPYHRYPLLAFLLLVMGMDLTLALRKCGAMRFLAVAGLIFGAFFLAPVSVVKAVRWQSWNQEFIASLEGNLNGLGGQELSGRIQCMDMTVGCLNTLYRMRLVEDTGFLSDCYLLAPQPAPPVLAVRNRFWQAMQQRPPEIFVVTDEGCSANPAQFQSGLDPGYSKLDHWPQFKAWLTANYSLAEEWSPSRPGDPRIHSPFGYRIYEWKR